MILWYLGRNPALVLPLKELGESCMAAFFPLPPRLFVQGFLFLSHVPDSSVGTLRVRGRERGQALASKDTVSSWQPWPLRRIGLVLPGEMVI